MWEGRGMEGWKEKKVSSLVDPTPRRRGSAHIHTFLPLYLYSLTSVLCTCISMCHV